MIKIFTDIDRFKEGIENRGLKINIGAIISLDFAFFENYENFTLISLPDYDLITDNIIIISKKFTLLFSSKNFSNYQKTFKSALSKPYGESTVITLFLLKNVLKNYSNEFDKIRSIMNQLDFNPILEKVENVGRDLRKLTDRTEELVQIVLILREKNIREFNPKLIYFDYDMLVAESRYLLERCRSHTYRIASLRTKSEMKSNRELNETMSKLTIIMTFLMIVSIVVSVPGTIGAIFGIPALSDAYFKNVVDKLVIALVASTLLTIVLGWWYWRSLKLSKK